MARSEAQKAADKKYAQKTKDRHKQFAVNFATEEYNAIDELIKSNDMTKAEFIRWAAARLKEQNN